MARKRSLSIGLGLVVLTLALGMGASLASAKPHQILEFDTMVGVPQAFTGTQAPVRGVNGGGIPWRVATARGELGATGHLEIRVTGLLLDAGANAGTNPVASFRGLVSCLAADGSTQNVLTDPFPATTGAESDGGGNARIEAHLVLPDPCIAPIVLVTSPGGAWFSATGG